jgi:CMP-N,N'-diacetyllegionaminic acid synthase
MAAPKILAVIPARGGSKGVPRKNIRPVCGKPLIGYTIETALEASENLHAVIVSTDDQETAAIAMQFGAEVPFLRPKHLADDHTPTVPVLQHAVKFIEDRDDVHIDWALLLQPTDPFRLPEDVRAAIDIALAEECDSVISVKQVFSTHPILMKKINEGQLEPFCITEKEGTRRQDYDPPAYMRNGAIYLTRRDVLMNDNSIWGETIRPYIMPEERSVGVDSEMDMKLVEILMAEKLEKKEKPV